MAEKLDTYDFTRRGSTKYQWDQWFDGSPWQLSRKEDFPDVKSAANFVTTAKAAAKRRNLKLHTSMKDSGETVVIQAYTTNGQRPATPNG